jgi:tRNA nucleotidyltransferase (CCA-adding enzyme)
VSPKKDNMKREATLSRMRTSVDRRPRENLKDRNRMIVPKMAVTLIERLQREGHRSFVVGGAIRDSIMNRPVLDWDIVTTASPAEIASIFSDFKQFSLQHGTVTIVDSGRLYEVTTMRRDGDSEDNLVYDLEHRDFTINAMAYDIDRKLIYDPSGGRSDIIEKRLRSVGDPAERFREDPLRLLRAVRIANELGFTVERETMRIIREMSGQLKCVSNERIRNEFMKILLSNKPSKGFSLLKKSGLLSEFLPELLEGLFKRQNTHHRYTIYRHIMETIDLVKPDPILRLTALFHDIAKPRVRKRSKGQFRFFGHSEASASLAGDIMERLRFSRKLTDTVKKLIQLHMVNYDPAWSEGAIRRLIRRTGPADIDYLIAFRKADLSAHGYPKDKTHLIPQLEKRIRELKERPLVLHRRDLAVRGREVMDIMGVTQGPEVGKLLDMLVEKVTEHPELNTLESLTEILKKANNSGGRVNGIRRR